MELKDVVVGDQLMGVDYPPRTDTAINWSDDDIFELLD